MTELCYHVINVAVATRRAGIGSITAIHAVRRSYYRLVAVTELRHLVINVAVTALCTGVSSITRLGASGSGYHRLVNMLYGSNVLVIRVDLLGVSVNGSLISEDVDRISLILKANVVVFILEAILADEGAQLIKSLDHIRAIDRFRIFRCAGNFGYSGSSVFGLTTEKTCVPKRYSYF